MGIFDTLLGNASLTGGASGAQSCSNVGTATVTKIVSGPGIAISPIQMPHITSGACSGIVYASACVSDGWSKPDTDKLLKEAVREHDAERSITIDAGTAYYCDDGSLFVECSLPCNNMMKLLIDERDTVKACDKELKVLEDMKNRISRMQEKVFELSLSQKVKDD